MDMDQLDISKKDENLESTHLSETSITESENKSDNEDVNISECDAKNIYYEGNIAVYKDPGTGYEYTWSSEKEKWVDRSNMYGFEDDTHTYTDTDGIKYFWDKEKNAWFPKIDDDFMAQYQLSYGFNDNTKTEEGSKVTDINEPVKAKVPQKEVLAPKGQQSEPAWFEVEDKQNTKVYVSNLPSDVTEQEFVDLMQKCGLIMRDVVTSNMKIKLYKEPDSDTLKGDGLCTYIRVESVDLALNLLDGSDFKGHKIKVERAKFSMKGDYDPKLKPKKRKRKDKEKLKKMQEKLFDWRPEKMRGERAKHEKVVILKNVFEPSTFDQNVGLILEFQEDLREESSKCGEVRKVIIYDRHPEGVAQINMKEPEQADALVSLLNGRWFCKRLVTAEIWDGKTKFKIAETDFEISQRLEKWDKFLECEEKKE